VKAWSRSYAIDANVILRFLLRDHEELSPKAKVIMDAVQRGSLTVACDPIQLAEVAWVLKSRYNLDSAQIAKSLVPIVSMDGFVIADKARYLRALELSASCAHGFGDACACALALTECEGRLISFDRKLSGIEGVERVEEL
jgi:predicted nucleic acid-binding protein